MHFLASLVCSKLPDWRLSHDEVTPLTLTMVSGLKPYVLILLGFLVIKVAAAAFFTISEPVDVSRDAFWLART